MSVNTANQKHICKRTGRVVIYITMAKLNSQNCPARSKTMTVLKLQTKTVTYFPGLLIAPFKDGRANAERRLLSKYTWDTFSYIPNSLEL